MAPCLIERFSKWLTPAAVATSVEPSGGATGSGPVAPAAAIPTVTRLEQQQLTPEEQPDAEP